jgi:hypothetical protein
VLARVSALTAFGVAAMSGFSGAMVAVPASTSSLLWSTSDGPGGGEVAAAFGRFRA